MMKKPRIGITIGDMCGIGPEIVLKVLNESAGTTEASISVIGPAYFVDTLPKHVIPVPVGDLQARDITLGTLSPRAGRAAVDYVEKAIELCQKGELDAIVTAPLNKEAMHMAGVNYPGHTEILAARTDTKRFAMVFHSPKLNIILSTIHIALADVSRTLTKEKVLETIELGNEFVTSLGRSTSRIAVAGLNPHAGEHGKFGTEEAAIIEPAIKAAQEQGIKVCGPYPGDTIFRRAVQGEFDLVVAHYHDQGLIPLKLIAFDTAVNVTVGLPFVRTSVDHGTAFDIAGKGIADPSSLREALRLAIRMVKNRKPA